jgi:hypothetical protein
MQKKQVLVTDTKRRNRLKCRSYGDNYLQNLTRIGTYDDYPHAVGRLGGRLGWFCPSVPWIESRAGSTKTMDRYGVRSKAGWIARCTDYARQLGQRGSEPRVASRRAAAARICLFV